MTTLADLHRSVQTTLATRRLGTPVFVRYLLQSQDKADAVPSRLAVIAAAVRDWLGQPLDRLYALGSARGGQVSLTLEFRGGVTAAVAWTSAAPRGDGLDLMVLGNHGALYHDAGSGPLWDDPVVTTGLKPEPALVALIERALRSGRPELAGGKARP